MKLELSRLYMPIHHAQHHRYKMRESRGLHPGALARRVQIPQLNDLVEVRIGSKCGYFIGAYRVILQLQSMNQGF